MAIFWLVAQVIIALMMDAASPSETFGKLLLDVTFP
jgi:hypothetical protein